MRKNCIFKNPHSLQEEPVSNLQTRYVRADKGRKCIMLDECYFLNIKNVTIDHCFYDIWWLLKEPFFDLTFTYCSRSTSIAFIRREIVSSSSATLLRSFSSLECLMRLSGTLAMNFWCYWTSIVFSLTPSLIFGNGVSSANEVLGRERSLSAFLNA